MSVQTKRSCATSFCQSHLLPAVTLSVRRWDFIKFIFHRLVIVTVDPRRPEHVPLIIHRRFRWLDSKLSNIMQRPDEPSYQVCCCRRPLFDMPPSSEHAAGAIVESSSHHSIHHFL
jgi:hypothetical protein